MFSNLSVSYVRSLTSGIFAALALAACGGGSGSSGNTPVGVGVAGPPSVSGDMIAYAPNRGWNYHGNAFGQSAVTISVYADPVQNGVDTLVAFASTSTVANAFSGTKAAALGLQSSSGGYNAAAYVILNTDGSTYAQGAIAGSPMLVPSTLTQGTTFTTYTGATATVQSVGNVPGSSACPTPTNGATVIYTFMGQSYSVSYVPGCGITDYVGNHGEHLTLASVGSYPQLGTQSVRRMDSLTTFDTVRSLLRLIATQTRWHLLP